MRIEKEIVETENGYTKDGIDYYYLKTYYIYSDKGTYVGAASIECTAKGFEPGTSITFQSRYNSLVEKAKKLDKEESQEQKEQPKEDEKNSWAINHGVNFLEGKPCSTLSGDTNKTTYNVTITNKNDGVVWIEKKDFDSRDEANKWVDEQKNQVNAFIGDMKVWKPNASGELQEEPLGITFDDEYSVEINEVSPNNEKSSAKSDLQEKIGKIELPAELSPTEIAARIQSEVQSLTTQISTDAVSELMIYATSLPATIPSRIQKHTMDTFNERKTTLSKELGKLGVNIEDDLLSKAESYNSKAKAKILEQAQKLIGDAQTEIEKALDKVDSGAQDIARHAEEGISYVKKQIKNFVEPIQKTINSKCQTAKNNIEKTTDQMCESVGQKVGQTMAEKYNRAIEIAAKEQYQKIETNKKKAITKAYAAKQKAILKVMGMLGFSA